MKVVIFCCGAENRDDLYLVVEPGALVKEIEELMAMRKYAKAAFPRIETVSAYPQVRFEVLRGNAMEELLGVDAWNEISEVLWGGEEFATVEVPGWGAVAAIESVNVRGDQVRCSGDDEADVGGFALEFYEKHDENATREAHVWLGSTLKALKEIA